MDTTYLNSLQKKQELEKIQAEIRNSCSEMKKENTIIKKEKEEIRRPLSGTGLKSSSSCSFQYK